MFRIPSNPSLVVESVVRTFSLYIFLIFVRNISYSAFIIRDVSYTMSFLNAGKSSFSQDSKVKNTLWILYACVTGNQSRSYQDFVHAERLTRWITLKSA